MTIAICFRTPEGVVLGADSATTYPMGEAGERYLNHSQKVFQVDDEGSMGIVTFGSMGLGDTSIRTLIARLGDRFRNEDTRPKTVREAAFWLQCMVSNEVQTTFRRDKWRLLEIADKVAAGLPIAPRDAKFVQETMVLAQTFLAGFYVGGRDQDDREPTLYTCFVRVTGTAEPPMMTGFGWVMNGATQIPLRLLRGWNADLLAAVLGAKDASKTPFWKGSAQDLRDALASLEMSVNPHMPIREAVDFVHSMITMTAKAVKFGQLPPSVGGPAEVAVITSDRPFRWIRHKGFDSAF